MIHHGIAIRSAGSAIVSVERAGDARVVTGIERFPIDVSAVVARLDELAAARDSTFIIDADHLGAAVWRATVGDQRRRAGWQLYAKRGPDRAEITTDLAVAFHEQSFAFAHALDEQQAMTKALVAWRRETRDDGPDSELVVALRHALAGRPAGQARIW